MPRACEVNIKQGIYAQESGHTHENRQSNFPLDGSVNNASSARHVTILDPSRETAIEPVVCNGSIARNCLYLSSTS